MRPAIGLQDSEQTVPAGQSPLPRFIARALAVSALLGLVSGCATTGIDPEPVERDSAAIQPKPQAPPAAAPPVEPAPPATPPTVWATLREGFAFPPAQHPRIQREIARLTRSPAALDGLLERGEPYLHFIAEAVREAGLPAEIALLPAVESGFRAYAHSPNGAAGLWQFMPATGQMLGLERDWWYDGRRTVTDSTHAAITYLSRLHRRFDGDWLHALAAYNAGARTVSRAIRQARRRGRPTDYWSLDLPRETDNYVPRLLALVRVVRSPEAYGVALPEIVDQAYFASVDTGGQIDLSVAAELAGVPIEELLRLNPGYRRWASRPGGPHKLLVPTASAASFKQAIAGLPDDQRLRWQRHRIAPGENLIRIARQYGVSVQAIKQTNGLNDSRIRAGKDLLIPLSASVDGLLAGTSNSLAKQRVQYRVRRGDSLYKIARRFQVSIADLRRWNSVGRYIRPGERLTVYIDPDA
jgi:membrane-bound lytic murein transglycosylase D